MNFWPEDIRDDELRAPVAIMSDAADELESRSAKLKVSVAESKLADRIALGFELTNLDTGSTLTLFEVFHQPGQAYPLVIVPPESHLPEFLHKRQYKPGNPGFASSLPSAIEAVLGKPGRYVENEWVCSTPFEFVEKLKDLFNQSFLKSQLMSFLAQTNDDKVLASGTNSDPSDVDVVEE